MKKITTTIAILLTSLTLLTSCGGESGGAADIIEKWYKENGPAKQRKASKVNSATFVKDITALDSIQYLLVRFNFPAVAEREYSEAIKQINASEMLRAKSQAKIDETNAPSVKEYNQRDVDRFNATIKTHTEGVNGMIDAISGNFTGSKHDDLWRSIYRLKNMGEKTVVAKLYTADVFTMAKESGGIGNYMLDVELTKLNYDGSFAESWIPQANIDIESFKFEKLGNTKTTTEVVEEAATESEEIEATNETQYYKINDPDGYSNLRDAPKGNVIQKVLDSEQFEVIGEEAGYKKVKLSDGTTGYIHGSRVDKI